MRFSGQGLLELGVPIEHVYVSMERNMQCGDRALRPLPARPVLRLQRRPGLPLRPRRRPDGGARAVSATLERPAPPKPRVAVFKMASCDGCQLQLLDAEQALLELAGAIEISNFAEASSYDRARSLRRDAGRGLGLDAGAGGADPPDPRRVQAADHDRCVRDVRRRAGAPQRDRQARRVRPDRLPDARVRLLARGLAPDRRPTSTSTSSSPGARSTAASCWARSRRCSAARFHACRPRRSASSASVAATSASSSPRRAVPRPRDADRVRRALPRRWIAGATGASAPPSPRTTPRCSAGGSSSSG